MAAFRAKMNLLIHKDILLKFYEFLHKILENISVKFLLRVLKYSFENVLRNFQEILTKIFQNINQNVLQNIFHACVNGCPSF